MFDKKHKAKRDILLKTIAILMIISFVGFAIAPAFLQ